MAPDRVEQLPEELTSGILEVLFTLGSGCSVQFAYEITLVSVKIMADMVKDLNVQKFNRASKRQAVDALRRRVSCVTDSSMSSGVETFWLSRSDITRL